ncbi:methyl-accepting chemotaxis protein [Paludibacterium sp. B53371]|uniref:methyl-accepting chemotaxis protein n=1 Tax=Paludibacterium sp. B53371 TaxID=2806263 RepID=UPI001C0415F0|nr:methyl-accepting chemotaxis protein [Paludibacterium sp. B53371]
MQSGLSVRQKILSGFGIIILMMAVVVGMALLKINDLQQQITRVTDQAYPKVMLANQLGNRTLDNGLALRSALLAQDSAERQQWLARSSDDRQQIGQLMTQMAPLASDEREQTLLVAARQAREATEQSSLQVQKLVQTQHDIASQQATRLYLDQTFIPANSALLKVMEQWAQHEADNMAQAKTDAESAATRAYVELSIWLAISLALALVMAYALSGRLVQPLRAAMNLINTIEAGDLTGHEAPQAPSRDEAIELRRHLALMRERLHELISHIQRSAHEVSDSAHELSGMAQYVSSSTQQQAAATSSAAATIEQLTVSINHVADSAGEVAQRAVNAGALAHQGGGEAAQSAQQISVVAEEVSTTSNQMNALSQQVRDIDSIVTVIKEVADQTNLLALNAAIEAARAGEAGRGFAVVADEVRKLAERTGSSAQEITQMIDSIQQGVQEAVTQMNGNLHDVRQVSERAELAAQTMHQIETHSQEVNVAIGAINEALGEQREASSDLAQRMEQMTQMSDGNSATVEELATTSNQLSALSKDLSELTARFRL